MSISIQELYQVLIVARNRGTQCAACSIKPAEQTCAHVCRLHGGKALALHTSIDLHSSVAYPMTEGLNGTKGTYVCSGVNLFSEQDTCPLQESLAIRLC